MGRASRRKRNRPELTLEHLLDPYRRPVRENVVEGVICGVAVAGVVSLVAALSLLIAAVPRAGVIEPAKMWALAAVFYLGAGILGGAVYGLLRRVQDRYWGQFLTAYLILFLVYGGGTATFLPLIEEEPVPLGVLLPVWAVLCLILAPIYVALTKRAHRRENPA